MEPSEGLSRRIFIKSAAAAGVTLAGLTGCGSEDSFAFTGTGGVNGGPNQFIPPNVPVLTPRTRVEPAVVPGFDAGTRYSVQVVASQGGSLTLPEGTRYLRRRPRTPMKLIVVTCSNRPLTARPSGPTTPRPHGLTRASNAWGFSIN